MKLRTAVLVSVLLIFGGVCCGLQEETACERFDRTVPVGEGEPGREQYERAFLDCLASDGSR